MMMKTCLFPLACLLLFSSPSLAQAPQTGAGATTDPILSIPCATDVWLGEALTARELHRYDDQARLIETITIDFSNPEAWTLERFEYDDQGQRIRRSLWAYQLEGDTLRVVDSSATQYQYDQQGREVRRDIAAGLDWSEETNYLEEQGRITRQVRSWFGENDYHVHRITTDRIYDDTGRLIGEVVTHTRQPEDESTQPTTVEPPRQRTMEYDEAGRLLRVIETGEGETRLRVHQYDCI